MSFEDDKHPRDEGGRWKAVAAGGVLGSSLAALGLYHEGRKVAAAVAGEDARHAHREAIIERRRVQGLKRASKGWPVPLQRKVLAHDIKGEQRAIQRLPGTTWEDEDGKIVVPDDQDALQHHNDTIRAKRGEIDALADAVPGKRVKVKATKVKAAKPHVRIIRLKAPRSESIPTKQEWEHEGLTEAEVEAGFARSERIIAEREARAAANKRTRAAERKAAQKARDASRKAGIEPADIDGSGARRAAKDLARQQPGAKKRRGGTKEVKVGKDRAIGADQATHDRAGFKRREQGTPDDKTLKAMRRTLRDRVETIMRASKWREFDRHGPAAEAARRSSRILNRLPTRGARGIVIAGAGVAGAIAAWAAHRAITRKKVGGAGQLSVRKLDGAVEESCAPGWRRAGADLAKVAPPDDSGGGSPIIDRAAKQTETDLAARFAHVFRAWKDDATQDLLHAAPGALNRSIRDGIEHATKPIEAGMRGGAGAPVNAVVQGEGGPKVVSFLFGGRSPAVESYIRDYRESRIAELSRDQEQTIHEILLDSARAGATPDGMALRIRQAIGLTRQQAQAVANFRAGLERLDPAVLGRSLRDKRYDRTVAKAISTREALTDEQVAKMTDAYHRKYLAYRAMTIARTEGVGAANNGHMAVVQDIAGRMPGYTVAKTWIATNDARTRRDHRALHGQTVFGLDTPFTVEHKPTGDLDEVLWPHNGDAPARQVINCRCTIATRLIPIALALRLGLDAVPKVMPLSAE